MTEIEVYLGMPHYRRFAVLGIIKHRRLINSIFLPQCLAQQHIGGSREFAALLMLEGKHLGASLLRHHGECRLQVNRQRILVNI